MIIQVSSLVMQQGRKKSVSATAKEFNIKRLLGGINKIHFKTKLWWFPIHELFKTQVNFFPRARKLLKKLFTANGIYILWIYF